MHDANTISSECNMIEVEYGLSFEFYADLATRIPIKANKLIQHHQRSSIHFLADEKQT